ncbi:MAG: hypothetical protein KAI47_22205, partial [Deltaproteobacteria bacterium]|nr:hypothetical protein [Deltaproteobacteria bacterium]
DQASNFRDLLRREVSTARGKVTPMRSLVWKAAGVALLFGGALLFAYLGPPAPFSLDDDNHVVSVVALRGGSFVVPGTRDLSPSRELFWFDPAGHRRPPAAQAVSTLPPFYAVMAQPFAAAGWRGLLFLQAAMFFFSVGFIFWLARRRLADRRLAWVAAITLGLGAALVEYALGLWPHMLSMVLCTVAFVWVSEDLGGDMPRAILRLGGGLFVGLAIGVRYQNIVYALGLALGILLLSRARLREGAAFGMGLLPPLLFNAFVNHARLGTFNPITKGAGYLSFGASKESRLVRVASAFVSRIFDSSLTPVWSLGHQRWWSRDPKTHALMSWGILKKAWIQSLPWAALPLILMFRAWFRPASDSKDLNPQDASEGSLRWRQTIDLRLISLVISVVIAAIISFGPRRHDGLSFNQRYFIDLAPLLVHGLMITLDGLGDPKFHRRLFFGFAVGVVLAMLILSMRPRTSIGRQLLILRVPLVLALLLVGAWFFRHRARFRKLVGLVAGIAIGWAAGVHLAGDVRGSIAARHRHYSEGAALAQALPRHESIAVFAYSAAKDALGPLMLTRDLVVADPHNDGGATAPRLVREFLAQGRRVFVITNGHGGALFSRMREGLQVLKPRRLQIPLHRRPWTLVELRR